jgi:hypothetical protein
MIDDLLALSPRRLLLLFLVVLTSQGVLVVTSKPAGNMWACIHMGMSPD